MYTALHVVSHVDYRLVNTVVSASMQFGGLQERATRT